MRVVDYQTYGISKFLSKTGGFMSILTALGAGIYGLLKFNFVRDEAID